MERFLEAEAEDRATLRQSINTTCSNRRHNGPASRLWFRAAGQSRARLSPIGSISIAQLRLFGAAAPGYSSGQAMAALEEVARNAPSGMGYDWADLSYQENKAAGTAGTIFGLSLARSSS